MYNIVNQAVFYVLHAYFNAYGLFMFNICFYMPMHKTRLKRKNNAFFDSLIMRIYFYWHVSGPVIISGILCGM